MIFALLCFGIVIGTFGLCYGILGLALEDEPFVNKKIQPGKHYRATQPLNLTTVPDKTDIFCVDFIGWNLTIPIKKNDILFLISSKQVPKYKERFYLKFLLMESGQVKEIEFSGFYLFCDLFEQID
jgi:hypothetical protein